MVKRRISWLGLCVLGLGIIPASAQAPPTLTLQQAETIALKNHPEVIAAQLNALASNQVVRQVRSAYFPTVYGDVIGSEANHGARLGAGYLSVSRLYNRFGQGVTVDQLITDSGQTHNLVKSSQQQAQAAQANAQATRYDVLLAVNHAYFEVLRAQALLDVAKETVAERQVVQDQVSALVQNKLKSQLDLSFANVNVSQAQLMQIRAQNNVSVAQAELTRAMGLQTLRNYTLVQEPLPAQPPPSSAVLVAQAMANRPELIGLHFSRNSAYDYERAERDLSFPTLAAVGVAGAIPFIERLAQPSITPSYYTAAALDLQIPIFNGHRFAARRAQAMLQAQAADQNLRDMQERIARDVRVAWANAVTGYQQIGVANQLLNQSKLALALAQGRYNLGLSSIVALTQAQLSETQAAVQDVNAKYDFQNENAGLEYQTGTLK